MIDETFIRSLGIIIIAATVFALVARIIRMPAIVAYLAAGLFLGPLTQLIEIGNSIRNITDLGIIFLLFLVGLELRFEKIREVGKVALLAGTGQVLVTAMGGYGLAYLLGFGAIECAFLAAALTFSSTVIAVKLLGEKSEFNTVYGRIAIGILLVQDLTVIILLTFLNGLEGVESIETTTLIRNLIQAFGGMMLLLILSLAASKWILPRPFAWAAQSQKMLFIWSLCWCFVMVQTAHLFHLSHETGAFLAGMSLAQLPYNHELTRRVNPLMNLFIAVFFVSLGAKMEFGEIRTLLLPSAVMICFVMLIKPLIIMFFVSRFGYGERTTFLAGLTLSQISEFSFIVLGIGFSYELIDHTILSLVGIIGVISFSTSAFGIIYNHRIFRFVQNGKWLSFLNISKREEKSCVTAPFSDHVVVVGMNTLGKEIALRLHDKGETVLAIDTDLRKLNTLPTATIMGDVQSLALLEEAGFRRAKLLVTALQIESVNELLAYRCRCLGIPCAVNTVDLSVVDNLLLMDPTYLMIPKADGIKFQNKKLKAMGFLD